MSSISGCPVCAGHGAPLMPPPQLASQSSQVQAYRWQRDNRMISGSLLTFGGLLLAGIWAWMTTAQWGGEPVIRLVLPGLAHEHHSLADLVLWLACVTGVLGATALAWTAREHYGRRETVVAARDFPGVPAHQRDLWQRLHYCAADRQVFDPSTGLSSSADSASVKELVGRMSVATAPPAAFSVSSPSR